MKKRKRKPTPADRIKALPVSSGTSMRDVHAASLALPRNSAVANSCCLRVGFMITKIKAWFRLTAFTQCAALIAASYAKSRAYCCKLRELLQLYDVPWL